MVLIALAPEATAFQPRLDVVLLVRLTHDGATPIEIPNPAALRAAPAWRIAAWPDGAARVIGNQQGFAPPRGQPERLVLQPGETWTGRVPISAFLVPLPPGDWAVSLLLPVEGAVVESDPCRVSVAEWSIIAADAGLGVPPFRAQEGDCVLLQGGPGPITLYRMPWLENDSDRTDLGAAAPIPLAGVGLDATDPLVPLRDGPFWGDPARWLLWREGAVVHAIGTAGERQSLTLAEAPAALLRPALQRTGADVIALALSADRRRIDLLRFPRKPGPPPKLAGTLPLNLPAESGTAGFGPDGDILIGLIATAGTGIALMLAGPDLAAPPRQAIVPAATPMANAPPCLSIRPDGAARLGALLMTEAGILLAEAVFPTDPAEPPVITRLALGWPEVTPIGATLLFAGSHHDEDDGHDHSPAPMLVIGLDDGRMLRLNAEGALEEARYPAAPMRPYRLLPTGHGAFLPVCSGIAGPFMAEG